MSKPCPNCSHPIDVGLFYGGGRKTKCTPELTSQIADEVRNTGCSWKDAALAAGVHRNSLLNWRTWGEDGSEIYAAFLGAVTQARARWKVDALRKLESVEDFIEDTKAAGAFVASMKFKLATLEREDFGPTLTVQVSEAKQELFESLARVIQKRGLDMSLIRDVLADLKGTPLEPRSDALN